VPHRLGLPAIVNEIEHREALGVDTLEVVRQSQRSIRAAIVREYEAHSRVLAGELFEGGWPKASLLAEAANDDGDI
jgi:hypothetical protein